MCDNLSVAGISLSHTHTNTHTPPQVLCGQLCVCVSCKDVAGWCVEVEAEGGGGAFVCSINLTAG